jgi:hypothetical protein
MPESLRVTRGATATIDGAIAVAPELAERNESLRQAAAGVAALLAEVSADHVQGDAQQAMERLMRPLEPLVAPLLEAALLLDPSIGKPNER